MPSETSNEGQSVYVRLGILAIGWAAVGAFLYALSTILPAAVLGIIALAAWAVVRLDPRKNKSLAMLLCLITCSLTGVCAVAMHFTHWHEDVLARLIFVGFCLGAGLKLLDRRADGWW